MFPLSGAAVYKQIKKKSTLSSELPLLPEQEIILLIEFHRRWEVKIEEQSYTNYRVSFAVKCT